MSECACSLNSNALTCYYVGFNDDPNGKYKGKQGTLYIDLSDITNPEIWVKTTDEHVKTGWI